MASSAELMMASRRRFAGVQLFVALLQRLALGNQRALVNHRAQVLAQRQQRALLGFDAGNVQITRHAAVFANVEHHFRGVAAPWARAAVKAQAHPIYV